MDGATRAETKINANSSTQVTSSIEFAPNDGPGSAVILLEKSEHQLAPGQAPPQELTKAFCHWRNNTAALIQQARNLCARFPQDRDARYLLAETLRGAGMDDLAAVEYQSLFQNCPPTEPHRVDQSISQCRADRVYCPQSLFQPLPTP